MTDVELIKQSKTAWHDEQSVYIHLPIFSTDGTRLMDIAFKKEGHQWVGGVTHEQMVELVRTAETLRKRNDA
jgi:hypothetical protein